LITRHLFPDIYPRIYSNALDRDFTNFSPGILYTPVICKASGFHLIEKVYTGQMMVVHYRLETLLSRYAAETRGIGANQVHQYSS
jgi:hypothetical protein